MKLLELPSFQMETIRVLYDFMGVKIWTSLPGRVTTVPVRIADHNLTLGIKYRELEIDGFKLFGALLVRSIESPTGTIGELVYDRCERINTAS